MAFMIPKREGRDRCFDPIEKLCLGRRRGRWQARILTVELVLSTRQQAFKERNLTLFQRLYELRMGKAVDLDQE